MAVETVGSNLSRTQSFGSFPQSLNENARIEFSAGYEHFLPNPFSIIIKLLSYNLKLYSVVTESEFK